MDFQETPLPGVFLIGMKPIGDARGHFVRSYCAREFAARGLDFAVAQSSESFSRAKGTLRGLHFQAHPSMEAKLVRCIRGSIFDVMVDIRPGSATFGKWFGAELTEANNLQLFAPEGFAHGFQTLQDDVVVGYQIGQFYESDKTGGVRYDDPAIGINWPLPPVGMSPRDLELPLLADVPKDLLLALETNQ